MTRERAKSAMKHGKGGQDDISAMFVSLEEATGSAPSSPRGRGRSKSRVQHVRFGWY